MSPVASAAEPPPSSATALVSAFRNGDASPVEVLATLARRATEQEPALAALTTSGYDAASDQAAQAELRWSRGTARPLEGVPVLVKDLIDTADLRTTYGSAMFAEHVPPADAEVVAAIRRAGGIVVAKTTTHEFGWGITTENPHYGAVRNPWATDRIPGGSSGGSAAALAAGYAPLALGTDTAGSVRLPASFCGVAGLRPTFGAVPDAGVPPLAPSADATGPMARTVADLRLLWTIIGPRGPAGEPRRVGMLREADGVHPEFDALTLAADRLADAGLEVIELDASALPPAYPLLGTTLLAEGLLAHRRRGLWPHRAGEYGPDIRARLELAEAADPAAYTDAQRGRALLRSAWARLLTSVDVVISPAAAVAPPQIGAVPENFRELVLPAISPQSLAGLPALVVPAGIDAFGRPAGVQLTGSPWCEQWLFITGEVIERPAHPVNLTRQEKAPNVIHQR